MTPPSGKLPMPCAGGSKHEDRSTSGIDSRAGVCMMRGVKRAFTLIELLVVVATIAVILAVALPALSGARERARVGKCLSNLRSLATYSAHFIDAHNRLPDPFIEDDEVPDLRCPCAKEPDTGAYGFAGQAPSSGVFIPTTWVGRSLPLNPSKVSLVMCHRHSPYLYGYFDGHAR